MFQNNIFGVFKIRLNDVFDSKDCNLGDIKTGWVKHISEGSSKIHHIRDTSRKMHLSLFENLETLSGLWFVNNQPSAVYTIISLSTEI